MPFRGAALVAGLVAAAWVASHDPSVVPPPSSYPGYRLTDTAAVQLIEPVLHAPWIGAMPWIVAALLALCLASEAWLLAIACGATVVAASAVVIALVVSTPWLDTVRHGGPLAVALAFAWIAWMFILITDDRRDLTPRGTSVDAPSIRASSGVRPEMAAVRTPRAPLAPQRAAQRASGTPPLARQFKHTPGLVWRWTGIVSWAIAVAASWLALVMAPLVFAGLTAGDARRRVRLGLVVAASVFAMAGLAVYCWRVADVASSFSASATVGPTDVLATLFDRAVRRDDRAVGELGPAAVLAAGLAALGIVGAEIRKRWRVGAVIAGASVAGIALTWPLWAQPVVVLGLWLSLPFVAVGLTVAARAVPPRWRTMATASGGVLLCVASASETFAARDPREPANHVFAPVLGSMAVDNAVLVAEDVDVDAAVIAAVGGRGGWRLARDPAHVAELVEQGRAVLAGPAARRQLELAGFRFRSLTAGVHANRFDVSRVDGQLHCAVVRADRWSLLPGLEYTGRLGIEIPGGLGGAMTLVVGDDDRPRLVVTDADGEELRPALEPLLTAPAVDAPPPDYWLDGGDPARAPSQAFRVALPSHPTAPTLLDVALGRRAPRVLARLTRFDGGARGRICAAPLAAPELWTAADAPREAIVPLTMSTMLTAGWHGVEGEAGNTYRWTDATAIVLVASARRTPLRVAIDAEAAAEAVQPALRLTVNGVEQPPHAMRDGRFRYEWTIPAAAWLAGTNELQFRVSHVLRPADAGGQDVRVLGMKVSRLALTRLD